MTETHGGRRLLWTWFGAVSVVLLVSIFRFHVLPAAVLTVGIATVGEVVEEVAACL